MQLHGWIEFGIEKYLCAEKVDEGKICGLNNYDVAETALLEDLNAV